MDDQLTFYVTHHEIENDRLNKCKEICEQYGISYTEIIDRSEVQKLSRGHTNPANGFVIKASDNIIMLSPDNLCSYWINKQINRKG